MAVAILIVNIIFPRVGNVALTKVYIAIEIDVRPIWFTIEDATIPPVSSTGDRTCAK